MNLFTEPTLVTNFQLGFNELPEEEQEKLKEWMYDLLYTLYENEEGYTESLYDGVGWTEEVKTFLRYNANKALMNLGQDPLFPDSADDVNPIVMNGISTGTSNHDFFSQVGNGYLLGEVEAMQDDDYNLRFWTNSLIPELITNIMVCLKQP